MKLIQRDAVLIAFFIVFGVLTRTVWHMAPNVEFVTGLTLAGGYFLRKRNSLLIPVGIMVVSDALIGNTPIFLFTWSAYGGAWLIGQMMHLVNKKNFFIRMRKYLRLAIISEVSGIVFTLFFFFWTNFGVVVVSGLYPKSID